MGDPVVGIVEPSPAIGVARLEPFRADQHHHRVGAAQGVADHLAEVGAAGNALDVAENPLVAEIVPSVSASRPATHWLSPRR